MAQIQRILVTGATGALGSRVCERFLQAGKTVVGIKNATPRPGEDVQPDTEHDRFYWASADLTDPAMVQAAVAQIEAKLGPIDALIHCAGGFRWTLMGEASDADIDFLLDVNLRSSLLLLREILPKMKQRNRGRIVLISSKSTLNPATGEGPYAATKAALNALTKSVADEVKTLDVTINAVLPSVIDTPANRQAMPDANFEHWVPRDQLADIIFSLTEPASAAINGALIPVAAKM